MVFGLGVGGWGVGGEGGAIEPRYFSINSIFLCNIGAGAVSSGGPKKCL